VKREAEEDWEALMAPSMDRKLVDDSDYWRNRAEEARAVGVQMMDAHTRAVMFSIAQDYEKLARRAELRARKRCTDSDNYYTFRVECIQGQIEEEICAHDDQSEGANQVDRSAHRSRSPSQSLSDNERSSTVP
jgi:hypothetical protein